MEKSEVEKSIAKYSRLKPFNIDKIKISDRRIAGQKIPGKNRPRERRKVKDEKFIADYLASLYNDIENPGSFQGVEKLYDAVIDDGLYEITHKQIQKWLESNFAYTLNRQIKKVKRKPRVIVSGIDDQFDADLADMSDKNYSDANDGVKFLLIVIDIFSRFLWVQPLKDKSAETVLKAFQKIFSKSKRIPRRLRTDRGSEFTNEKIRQFMTQKKIFQMFTSNEVQANYAERVIKTLKSKIFKFMVNKNTFEYVKDLQKFVNSYNETWHHGIRAKPVEVSKKNESRLWWQMYWPSKNAKEITKKQSFRFEVGENVRISVTRQAFAREYDQRWSGEIFKIRSRFRREKDIRMYRLEDYTGDIVTGSFYENELQRVTIDKDEYFVIDKILDEKIEDGVKKVLVHYRYWPKKFDRWIKASTIKDLREKRKVRKKLRH